MEILEEKCRLCGGLNPNKTIVTSTSENIIKDIFNYTGIEIKNCDFLPKHICINCYAMIQDIKLFRFKCHETQKILLQQIKGNKDYSKICKQIDANSEININSEDKFEGQHDIFEDDELEIASLLGFDEHEQNRTENSSEYCVDKIIKSKSSIKGQLSKEERKIKYRDSLRPCDQCGKMVEKSRIQGHINQHLGIKPFVCNLNNCEKSFYCSYILNNHKRDYHSKQSFECDICGKSYRLQKSLYNHKQKHNTPRYVCGICDRRYKNSTYLKQHMRTHTGERPYNCTKCEKTFASAYNLKAHIRSHTKEKPFICKLCNSAYGYNQLLKNHMKKCQPERNSIQ